MFSYPVNCFWNPTPIDSNDIELPCKLMLPLSALNIPDIALKRVLFPLPFLPHIPSICPFGTSNVTPFTALNIFPDPRDFSPLFF